MTSESPKTLPLLTVLGATATGKTRLAVALARDGHGEIISADSRQVYRGMDLGTGKDWAEYGEIPCHLIDVVDPGYRFSLFEFQQRCRQAIQAIHDRGRLPILAGGSGLYLESVLLDYQLVPVAVDPDLRAELAGLDDAALRARLDVVKPHQHNTSDQTDRESLMRAIEIAEGSRTAAWEPPPFALDSLVIGLRWERPVLAERIGHRLRERIEAGMIAEAAGLIHQGLSPDLLAAYGLEYRFLVRHLRGEVDRETMVQQLHQAIKEYAKRQEMWFRRMERRGIAIHWLDGAADPCSAARELIRRVGWPG